MAYDKDKEIWEKWKQDRSHESARELLQATAGVRQQAINNWSGSISPTTLQSEALKLSMEAFDSYDPGRNVKLTTHLTNSLKKMSRMAYNEVSFLRLPEDRQLRFSSYNNAKNELSDFLGRDPSAEELSDELGWPVAEVIRMQNEDRNTLIASEPLPVAMETHSNIDGSDPDHAVHYALTEMPGVDQQIFRHTTGYGGAPIYDAKQMKKNLGINQNQLSYRKKKIVSYLKGVKGVGS